jgi:DNA topoisomerase IA
VTTSLGWPALYLQNDEEIGDKLSPAIPDQMPGVAESVDVLSRKTAPPQLYTDATLLEDMKSVAKYEAKTQQYLHRVMDLCAPKSSFGRHP